MSTGEMHCSSRAVISYWFCPNWMHSHEQIPGNFSSEWLGAVPGLLWIDSREISSIFSAGSWQNGGVGQCEYKWQKAGPATRKRDKGICGKMRRTRVKLGLMGQGSIKGATETVSEGKTKEELVRWLLGRKKTDKEGNRAGLEGKSIDWFRPTIHVFYELGHFPQETPKQPSLNTPQCL